MQLLYAETTFGRTGKILSNSFLKKLTKAIERIEKKSFNQFDIFDDVFKEDYISKILTYFFDSKNDHDLGNLLIVELLKLKIIRKDIPGHISLKKIETKAEFNKTFENTRRIDIYIECFDCENENEEPIFYLGIEVKKGHIESKNQIRDYQSSLEKLGAPSLILFLTPHGKEAKEANRDSCCKCIPVSYKTISGILKNIETSNKEVKNFLEKFGVFMSKSIAGKIDSSTQKQINELWQKHQRELRLIMNYGKKTDNPKSFFYEELVPELYKCKAVNSAYIDWHFDRSSAVPWEYNLCINEINNKLREKKKPYSLYYMIYNEAKMPMDDPNWTMYLAAYPDDDSKYNETAKRDAEKYQECFDKQGRKPWVPWTFFEVGPTFSIEFDKQNSAEEIVENHLKSFIDETQKRLREYFY